LSLLSAPGSVVIKITLMKPLPEALWCTSPCSCQNKYLQQRWQMERYSADQSSWSLYNSKVDLVLQETPPGAKRTLCMASAFLGKYAYMLSLI